MFGEVTFMTTEFLSIVFFIIVGAANRISFARIWAKVRYPQASVVARLLCLSLLFALGTTGLSCQTQPNLENGFKPYGSYDASGLDTVNLMNGGRVLHAPLLPDYPQRGAITPHINLYDTSKHWQVRCIASQASGGQTCFWTRPGGGVAFQSSVGLSVHRTMIASGSGTGTTTYSSFGYSITSADASTHSLYPIPGTSDATGEATKFESQDTSGYHLELSNPDGNGIMGTVTVTDRHGIQYLGSFLNYAGCPKPTGNRLPQPGNIAPLVDDSPLGDRYCSQVSIARQVTDSNGNIMSLRGTANQNPGIDTLGRTMPLNTGTPTSDYSGCVSPLPIAGAFLLSYVAPDRTTQQIKQCMANVPLQTSFNQPGVIEFQNYGGQSTVPSLMLVTVVLADGTKWTFDYDSYGEVINVGLPTGGSISYTWTTIDFSNCNVLDHTAVSRAVATRTLNDNKGNSSTWTYNWGTAANRTLTNMVTDPFGNDTVHVFTAFDSPNVGSGGCGFYETSTQEYQGSKSPEHLLRQVDTSYASASIATDGSGVGTGLANVVPISIKTTVYPSGKVSLVTKTYDTGLGANAPIFGNVVSEKIYDWGQGAPGPLLRETDTSYVWQSDARYLAAHLVDLPASVVIKDGSGNRVAETDYIYDELQYITASNITTQHGASPSAVRGNLTTVSRWLNPGNTKTSSHTNWYDTGEVYQQIDPLGNTTTHSYDPVYAGAHSTNTQDALGHTVSGTYDFSTGLLTSFTNANATAQASGNTPGDAAHTSTYVYDFMSRMTSATLPADASGNSPQTTFKYPDATTVERLHKITASLTDDAFTYFDGLGRIARAKHVTPDGNALVDTTYDALGHAASVTNPYFSTSELTYGVTQSQYDSLGRLTQTTKPDGGISTVSYSDNCTTTTDEAGKQRRACVDGAGRLVEVDEPGDSFPGSLASGSLAISGILQSKSGVGAIGSTKASVGLTITGTNQFIPGGPAPACGPGTICNNTPTPPLYDAGKVYIIVNGHEYDYFYGGGGNTPDSSSSAAQGLVNVIQADAGRVINASVPANGSTITLTAVNPGSVGNFVFSTGSAYDQADFSGPSFTLSPGKGNLSGGTDSSSGVTVSDAGTVTAAIGSFTVSVNYGTSSNSTAQQVASALASALNVANSPVTASASGSNIAVTYKTIGTTGNVAVAVNSSTNQSQYFSRPSFTSSGGALSGGFNPQGPSLDHAYYVTQYFYDALDNLLCVEQHGNVAGSGCGAPASSDSSSPWRVRRFTYDSLSRLLTANNPESGLISYVYDANGNVLQKVLPAPNQAGTATHSISYCYDTLNRVTGRAYSWQNCQNGKLPEGTAAVSYSYDQGTNGIGHLTSFTDQAGSAKYSYDMLGRMSSEQRTIAGVTKSMSYTYNLDGSIASIIYPSGAVITYTLDSAGRILQAIDSGNNITYVTGATYNAANALTGSVYGQTATFSGIVSSFSFNNRLQPATLWSSSPTRTLMYLVYDFHLGNGDNGNAWGITNNRDINRNQTFTYDPLNRLISAQNAGTDCTKTLPDGHTEYWGSSYNYDAWGNLLGKSVTKCSAENLSLTAAVTNQLQGGYAYDSAGNMMRDNNGTSYSYDAENRIAGAAGFTYTYDADGNRIEKTNGITGTIYWYMTPGIVAESDLSGNLKSEYVFFDGERVARKDSPGNNVSYYFSDHLKTAALISDSVGNIQSESDYYPWGGELQFSNSDSNHYKFTGKERDSETGLDYFGARYYSNGLGRFVTPDWSATPVPVPYADLTDPQTLNQYSYVRNIPTSRADADGHCPMCIPLVIEAIELGISASEISAAAGTGALIGTSAGAMSKGASPTGCYGPCMGDGPLPGTPSWNRMMADFDKQKQAYNQNNNTQGGKSPNQTSATGQQQGAGSAQGGNQSATGGGGQSGGGTSGPGKNGLPPDANKLKGNQGYRDKDGNTWRKDRLHKDHWDVSNKKGDKIKEVDFDGKQIWPNGPKNKTK
jgi:RHS repeat-associated protein